MFKQVHDFPTVLRQLGKDAGIIEENTLLELTIGDHMSVYPRHYAHFGLPVRYLRKSIRASLMEIGESWWKRMSEDSRLKCIIQFELRCGSVDQPTDLSLSRSAKATEKVPLCEGY